MSTTLERSATNGASEATASRTIVDVPPEPQPRRRKWTRYAVGAAVLLVVLIAGGRWLWQQQGRVVTDDAYIDTDQVMVMSRISERVAAVLVEQNTFVHAGQPLVLLNDEPERARLALARSNLAQLGASATAARYGTALESELQSAQNAGNAGRVQAAQRGVSVALAQQAAAQDAVAVAQRDLLSARAAAHAADAAVPAALSALKKAQADETRAVTLTRQGYLASSALDAARMARSQAQAAYEAAKDQSTAARIAIDAARAKLEQAGALEATARSTTDAARSQVAVAQGSLSESAAQSRVPTKGAQAQAAAAAADAMAAQVRLAELDVQSARVTAPVDGWVAVRNVEVGQTVSPGQTLVTISPAKRIFVTANYKETQLGRIHPGQPVEITVDACRGQTFIGTVVGLAPVAQSALATLPTLTAPSNFVKVAQRVPVRVSLPKATSGCVFRPGMSVETAVLTSRTARTATTARTGVAQSE